MKGPDVTSVLIVGHEAIGAMMTGPSIRCWEMARVLSSHFEVTLAVPEASELQSESFRVLAYRSGDLDSMKTAACKADSIIVSGYLLRDFPFLEEADGSLIVDIYDPFPIENLDLLSDHSSAEKEAHIRDGFYVIRHLLEVGDFFVCGNEGQRDFWLGMAAACGRITPKVYAEDPTLRRLIDIVPMGISELPPENTEGNTDSYAWKSPGDYLIVWPGGAWEWLDPLTAVKAIHRLTDIAPETKLLFPGLRHPHPEKIGTMTNPDAVIRLAEELGLLGSRVICADWTPYRDRGQYLLASDVALNLHHGRLESRYAIRARLLDCIWTGTPVISTYGDVIAEDMAKLGLATLVAPGSVDGVADAILSWRANANNRNKLADQFKTMADRYRWTTACRPLVEYLRRPQGETNMRGQSGCYLDKPINSNPTEMLEAGVSLELQKEELRVQIGEKDALLVELSAKLCQKEAEINAANDMMDRVRRGKVMRLMNAIQSLLKG